LNGNDAGPAGSSTADEGPAPKLPAAPADCPMLATGTTNILGQPVELWVGQKQADKKGPILLYWHGTGSVADEIKVFMQSELDEVQAAGGVAASFTTTNGMGANTGNNVWYTGDYLAADIIVACAVQQLNIDPRRIYAAGCSAGGLEAGSMVAARSSYLAAAMTNSGGDVLISGFDDPTHVPSIITTHGTYDMDFVILHFADVSKATDQTFANMGGFAMDCDHGMGHCGAPADDIAAQWQFVKDHPFGIQTDPYADGIPSSFPSYCTKVPATMQTMPMPATP
jgi:poly(3-hydroxybutyrate) depolymerase